MNIDTNVAARSAYCQCNVYLCTKILHYFSFNVHFDYCVEWQNYNSWFSKICWLRCVRVWRRWYLVYLLPTQAVTTVNYNNLSINGTTSKVDSTLVTHQWIVHLTPYIKKTTTKVISALETLNFWVQSLADCLRNKWYHQWQTPPPPQPFHGRFSGTNRVSQCQKKASSRLYDAREDNKRQAHWQSR